MLKGKKILIGLSGSIAAFKIASLVRLLRRQGAEVKVVMTESSKAFITPLTLSTLSGNPVYSTYFEKDSGEWHNHVDLALWADLMLIAPATANTIAKMANGVCDNLLLAVYLSAKCEVMIAPAMDRDMYQHPALKNNLQKLQSFGHLVLDTNEGELASGLVGKGRMLEPEEILNEMERFFRDGLSLAGKNIMVNAGPTYEVIDPVRFIGNRSTGKMGIAIANELHKRGAYVLLVLGPVNREEVMEGIEIISVESAREMWEACTGRFGEMDAAILTAAVADYKPSDVASQKMKKQGGKGLELKLEETEDVLASLGKQKKKGQILVGFALETDHEIENAKRKLERKNLDFIVLNSLKDEGAGFGHNTNKITIIENSGTEQKFELKTKKEVAADIVDVLTTKFN